MTNNQIAYWTLQETKQHNRESERFNIQQLDETTRHNIETEKLGSLQLGETSRANRVKEAETQRSNLAKELETNRSNLAKEKETYRHNVASENIDLSKLSETQRYNTGRLNIDSQQLQETQRHNSMIEYITQAANLADKLYKEAQTALKSRELDYLEQKEIQRISESLRDFNETVRNHDLQALTSKGLTSLITSLGAGLTGAGIAGAIQAPHNTTVPLLPGPTATNTWWSKLKGFGNKLLFINEKIFPDAIRPNNSNRESIAG